jgi:hypothetical protein
MKYMIIKKFIVFFIVASNFIFSQEFKPEIKVGATVFTGWDFNVDNAEFIQKLDTNAPNSYIPFGYEPAKNQFETSRNSFYLERAYINVIASLTPEIKARVTPDIFSYVDGGGKTQYALGIKFAYLDYTPFSNDKGMSLGFQLGAISNLWISTNERYWGYRGFQKTYTDFAWTTAAVSSGNTVTRTTSSFFSSADVGLGVNFAAPKGYAEISAEILNGNGFRNLSFDNRFKDLLFTAFIHPLSSQITKKSDAMKKLGKDRIDGIADLTFGGFAYLGKLDKGEQYKRNRFGGMLSLRFNFKKAGFVKIGGEFSLQKNEDPPTLIAPQETNTNGLSTYLEFNPPIQTINEKLMLVARFDIFDPNDRNEITSVTTFNDNNDKQNFLLAGFAFKPNKVLTLGVTYQSLVYEENFVVKYDGKTTKYDGRLLLQGILNF